MDREEQLAMEASARAFESVTTSDGIYWVYFELPKFIGEMRLQESAPTQDKAIKFAGIKAHKMDKRWKFTRSIGVR